MKTTRFDLSSAALHVFAMLLMLCDHLWGTIVPGNQWLTAIGRLAFPIFAFLIVEGYMHTRSLRRYTLRLLACALLSEIPFNLMLSGRIFNPVHQNVLWTFLLGLGCIHLNELARKRNKTWLSVLTAVGTLLGGMLAGYLAMVDYYGVGVVTVLVFYFFRGRRWWQLLAQAATLYYLNTEVLSGLYFETELFGFPFQIVQQSLAVLALIPIWLYRGRQGYHAKWFRWMCYLFYPLHMLALWALSHL